MPEATLPLEQLFGGVMAGFCRGEELSSVGKYVRNQRCAGRVSVFNEDVRMVFVEMEFTSRGFFLVR